MSNLTPQQKIDIYKNLFRGREDVFAVHWEKADKSAGGYTPVCRNEWKPGVCNKLKREKCKDCKSQNYAHLDDHYIEQHLRGNKTYGIYPLLDSNTSYFIVADFDSKNWQKDAIKFYQQCQKYNLSANIERSRSGNGGHVWLFFDDQYSASKSRNIAVHILQETKIVDQFDKEASFDRLFPNQDILSGKGFGNLIALPLQGASRENGNTIFLNPENNLEPFADQWKLLQDVNKISAEHLDKIYNQLNEDAPIAKINSKINLTIVLKGQLYINKNYLPKILINYLRNNLNFINSEFLIKKRMGMSVYGLERYFKLIQTHDDEISIPRGFLNNLMNFLNENNIKFSLDDQRNKYNPVDFESSCNLLDHQKEALQNMLATDSGILVAPPGSGKTIIGIELIAKQKQPALILVHKKQIFNQWIERIENFLNIPKREIGQLCSSKKKVGGKVTVAMIQTLSKINDLKKFANDNNFGLILVDECHHIPAKTFRNIITNFNPYYLYGLTATPNRKHNDGKLIFIYLGEILHTIENSYKAEKNSAKQTKSKIKIIIKNTNIEVPFKVRVDDFQVLSKIIVFDSNRNRQIVNDIKTAVDQGLRCLVLTERKDHVEVLNYYIKGKYETVILTGDLTEKQKKIKIKQIEAGHFQVLLATGQLIGEGADFQNLDCLFLVYPFSSQTKLTQYIGRTQRGLDAESIIYDYRDIKIDYLEKFFKKRIGYYRKNFGTKLKQPTLPQPQGFF
ncbi:MAG: DEAD/DEAH box helicase family protein [bacterium]